MQLRLRAEVPGVGEIRDLYSYSSFEEAKHRITEYTIGYYSQFRPHTHNDGQTPNAAEKQYWNAYKPVAKMT